MSKAKASAKVNFHAVRLSATETADLDAIIAAMTDAVTRPRVSISDALRTAIRVAAATMTPAIAGVA